MSFNVNGIDMGEKTRNPKESLMDQIFNKMMDPVPTIVAKKILISGQNSTGKTSLSLDLFSKVLKEDECIMYVGVDHSGAVIIDKFHQNESFNRNIISLDPYQSKKKDNVTTIDSEKTLQEIGGIAEIIREILAGQKEFDKKIIGVIVDGVSKVMQYCEGSMRSEKGLDASSGVSQQYWKDRAAKFRDFEEAYFSLPLPIIFISHEDYIIDFLTEEELGKFPKIKKDFLNDVDTRIVLATEPSEKNNKVTNYTAEIMKNRSDLNYQNRKFVFMRRHQKDDENDEIVLESDELVKMLFPNRVRSNEEK